MRRFSLIILLAAAAVLVSGCQEKSFDRGKRTPGQFVAAPVSGIVKKV